MKAKLNYKKRSSTLPLILIMLILIAVFAFLIYRNEIDAFADSTSGDKNGDSTEMLGEFNADLNSSEMEANSLEHGVGEAEDVKSEIDVESLTELEPEAETVTEKSEEDGKEAGAEGGDEGETEAVVAAEPMTEAETQPPAALIDAKDSYLPYMLASAIEISGADGKNILIESPPPGRELDLHSKIVPINKEIPNPSEYFSDVIFLGDSVTTGFDLFREYIKFNGEKVMLDTTVIAVKSYGVYNATRELSEKSVHPLLNGVQTLPEDIIAEKQAQKVFICLGLNDVSWQTIENYLGSYATLINRIREKSPEKTVYIMSITPLTAAGQKESLTNEKIMQFNNALIDFAAYNKVPFIDYAAALRDGDNHLYPVLSSDNYCHIVVDAYNRLTEYLIYHTIP